MSLAFHACPPPGAWFNDPCGLVRDAGGWTLSVRQRADAPALARAPHRDEAGRRPLTVAGDGAAASVVIDPPSGAIAMSRRGPDWMACRMTHGNICTPVNTRRLMLVVDGPVLELFLAPEGRVLSMILPDDGSAFNITLKGDGPEIGFDWRG